MTIIIIDDALDDDDGMAGDINLHFEHHHRVDFKIVRESGDQCMTSVAEQFVSARHGQRTV